MVMSKQPDSMRRVKRTAGADGKTSEYTIYLTTPQGEAEVGYSRRVIKGSVSKWEAYARTGPDTYQVFPDEYKDHNALMVALRDKYLENPVEEPAAPPAPAADAPAAPEGAAKPKRQRKAKVTDPGPGEVPTTATEPSGETVPSPATAEQPDLVPAHLQAGGHPVVIPPADPEAQEAVKAADAEPVVIAVAEVAEPDGTEEVVVVAEDAQGNVVAEAVAVVPGDLQPDGSVQVPPAAVFSGDPLADPLADPLSPAFMPHQ